MRKVKLIAFVSLVSSWMFAQPCAPIDNRNQGVGGFHAIICFYDISDNELACLDCQFAGASGWKCGSGFNKDVSKYTRATINGVPCQKAVQLPVELVEFSLENKSESVNFTFQTSSERELDYFIIESSKDGKFWQEVELIKAKGNSSSLTSYIATDPSPFIGKSYYRLSDVNSNGIKSSLQIIANDFVSLKFLVYPIPVNQMMFVEGDKLENSKISVVNSIGDRLQVESSFMGDKLSFNFSNIPNGVYFLVIENENIKKTERIVVFHK